MTISDEVVRDVLKYDALSEAERLTGKSYKEDPLTEFIGLGNHIYGMERKNALLLALDDTVLCNELSHYLRIIKSEGFVEVLRGSFVGNDDKPETYFIFFHPGDGILLALDTYRSDSVNSGNFYYNWIPNDWKTHFSYVSSGSATQLPSGELVWYGGHDCREALRFNIAQLRKHGRFVTPWVKRPFLWLLHYKDKGQSGNFEAINEERIARLPQNVRDAITPTKNHE